MVNDVMGLIAFWWFVNHIDYGSAFSKSPETFSLVFLRARSKFRNTPSSWISEGDDDLHDSSPMRKLRVFTEMYA
uniref:Uncharacterized protein n=1 Tax=Physcomitrium patens TaxID=3218 RepID=A0A2K1IXT2_PHYPA|nr:hypothetical protein PHYPA_023901 [Physcomitrium patens]